MRTLTDHIVEGDSANHQLTITIMDEPGAGGANHQYMIGWNGPRKVLPTIAELEEILAKNEPASLMPDGSFCLGSTCFINFQNGPIKEFGVNGVTQEALLAIVIDRLRSFQAGPFACEANQKALDYISLGADFLKDRTSARIARGVEGTHQK